jgi:hypothetical protein
MDDNAPFAWPPQPPYAPGDPAMIHAAYVGTDPLTGSSFLAGVTDEGNPEPSIYLAAGFLMTGPFAGRRLWAPARALPSAIRRVLRGERP